MAVYKIDDVLNSISDMKKNGFEYINVFICEVDDEDEDHVGESLFIDAIISETESETDIIDSVTLPGNYHLDM